MGHFPQLKREVGHATQTLHCQNFPVNTMLSATHYGKTSKLSRVITCAAIACTAFLLAPHASRAAVPEEQVHHMVCFEVLNTVAEHYAKKDGKNSKGAEDYGIAAKYHFDETLKYFERVGERPTQNEAKTLIKSYWDKKMAEGDGDFADFAIECVAEYVQRPK